MGICPPNLKFYFDFWSLQMETFKVANPHGRLPTLRSLPWHCFPVNSARRRESSYVKSFATSPLGSGGSLSRSRNGASPPQPNFSRQTHFPSVATLRSNDLARIGSISG